jgi:APA family basic amino acid/polyamine antiporter
MSTSLRSHSTKPSTGHGLLGLPAASALVVGSVIGTGVFGLPSALAAFGPISLVTFILVTIGSLALAIVFDWLSKRIPGSGGPYLYARDAFGDFAGFLNAWSYWVTAWAGSVAIVVALVGYVEVFTILKIVPLAAIAIIGLFFINPANFGPFNSSGTNGWSA